MSANPATSGELFAFLPSVFSFSHSSFFYVCVHFTVSLPLCCHDICVNAMPGSCFPFCVAGWSGREMLSSWSAQGTLWPEDHGQVFVSEVRNIWSIAPGICIFMLWLLYLLQIPQCTPYLTLFILYVFQVWNRNRANIWNTCPLWHQGKEKGFISFCSIWLVLIWHNESSFNVSLCKTTYIMLSSYFTNLISLFSKRPKWSCGLDHWVKTELASLDVHFHYHLSFPCLLWFPLIFPPNRSLRISTLTLTRIRWKDS